MGVSAVDASSHRLRAGPAPSPHSSALQRQAKQQPCRVGSPGAGGGVQPSQARVHAACALKGLAQPVCLGDAVRVSRAGS